MKKVVIALTAVTALSAILLGTAFAGGDETVLFTPEGYSDFGSPGPKILDRPMDIVKDRLVAFPETLEGSARLELKSYFDRGDRLVIDIVETGLPDDSVEGENRRYVFMTDQPGKFVLWGYGYRHRCARAEVADNWVSTPCP